jgi:hypothetical protein
MRKLNLLEAYFITKTRNFESTKFFFGDFGFFACPDWFSNTVFTTETLGAERWSYLLPENHTLSVSSVTPWFKIKWRFPERSGTSLDD